MKRLLFLLNIILFSTIVYSQHRPIVGDVVVANEQIYIRGDSLGKFIQDNSPAAVTSGSGVSVIANETDLGGTLNNDANILGAGYGMQLGTSGSKLSSFNLSSSGDVGIYSNGDVYISSNGIEYLFQGNYIINNVTGDTLGTLDDIRNLIDESAPVIPFNFSYTFSSTVTDARPGIGLFRLNNATYSLVTKIYIDYFDANSVDKSEFLALPDTGSFITISDGTNFINYQLTGTITDAGNYYKYEVTYLNNLGTITGLNTISLDLSDNTGSGAGVVPYIDFDTTLGVPDYYRGRLYVDTTLNLLTFQTGLGNSISLGAEMSTPVINLSGSDINNCDPVYVYASGGEIPRVALASNLIANESYSFIGLATIDIPHGSTGAVTFMGDVHGCNTSAFTESNSLYLTDGTYDDAIPATGHRINIGRVMYSNASDGVIRVHPRNESLQSFAVLNNVGDGGTYLDTNSVTTNKIVVDTVKNDNKLNFIADKGSISLNDSLHQLALYSFDDDKYLQVDAWVNTPFDEAIYTIELGSESGDVGYFILKPTTAWIRVGSNPSDLVYEFGDSNLYFQSGNDTIFSLNTSGISINGGDVLTTSDTIDLKTAVESETFDSISITRYDASLYVNGTPVTVTISVANTYYTITGLTLNYANNATYTDSTIVAPRTGKYDFNFYSSSNAANVNRQVHYSIFVNDIEDMSYEVESVHSAANVNYATAMSGGIYLNAGDIVKVKVKYITNTGSLDIEHMRFELSFNN